MKAPYGLAIIMTSSACSQSATPEQTDERPQDEVPMQPTLPNGDRQYSFKKGCMFVLEPTRAVVRSEARGCELYQRDIALLYASAD